MIKLEIVSTPTLCRYAFNKHTFVDPSVDASMYKANITIAQVDTLLTDIINNTTI